MTDSPVNQSIYSMSAKAAAMIFLRNRHAHLAWLAKVLNEPDNRIARIILLGQVARTIGLSRIGGSIHACPDVRTLIDLRAAYAQLKRGLNSPVRAAQSVLGREPSRQRRRRSLGNSLAGCRYPSPAGPLGTSNILADYLYPLRAATRGETPISSGLGANS